MINSELIPKRFWFPDFWGWPRASANVIPPEWNWAVAAKASGSASWSRSPRCLAASSLEGGRASQRGSGLGARALQVTTSPPPPPPSKTTAMPNRKPNGASAISTDDDPIRSSFPPSWPAFHFVAEAALTPEIDPAIQPACEYV